MDVIYDFDKELEKYGLTQEKYEQLLKDCSNKVQHIIDDDWSEICARYRLEFNPDTIRKGSQPPLIGSAFVSEYYKWKESLNLSDSKDDKYFKELQTQKRELQKERKKLQTEKLEYNKWLREDARDELIMEKICNSINNLEPMDIPTYIEPKHNIRGFVLAYGDEHFGVEYELKGLFGDIINSYSPEIFEERMWDLFNQVVEIIQKENIDTLNVFNMGDFNDGILRVSQLMKLRYGVIDGTIKYADFISNWLNELSKYVRIKYQSTNGNHSELRMLGQPKGTFTEDNMGKVVSEFIKIRLKDNPNFTYIENPTGFIYAQVACNTILGIHGEVKNMKTAIDEFSRIYNVPIQYLLAGHLHHNKTEEIGVNNEVINVGSIIGIDDYSLSLRKTANASAKLLIFEQNKGKICEYTLKLN